MFLLLRGFLLTSSPSLFTLNLKSAFSHQRSFGGKSSWARIWSHLVVVSLGAICMGNCSWFTDGKLCFSGHRGRSLCCLEMQNAPWHHWRMPSIIIFRERFMKPRISQLAKTRHGQQTARVLCVQQDYKVVSRGAPRWASLGIILHVICMTGKTTISC